MKMGNRFSIRITEYIILALGGVQTIIGTLQWLGDLPGHHSAFMITGSFYNPGPYACFLSVSVPVAVCHAGDSNVKMKKWMAVGFLLLCVGLISASRSRTALLAVCIGSIIGAYRLIHDYLKTILTKKKCRLIPVAVLGILTISILMYSMNKDSADGRLLIWKVAMQTARNVPLNGVGWNNVAGAYGEVQERYFALGNASAREKMIADAPEYAFNEYLQVAIAFGPIAALVMIAVVGSAPAIAFSNKNYGLAGSATAIAIVMFASYPLQFPIFVAMIVIVLTGCLLSSSLLTVKLTGSSVVMFSYILFLTHNDKTDVKGAFSIALSHHRQHCFRMSNEMLHDLKHQSSDPMILNIIGKNYQALGNADSAEYYFLKSTFRCPNRMYPHYLLMKLYSDSASYDILKCRNEAIGLLNMDVKIESSATRDMKREANLKLNDMKW